MLHCRIKSVGGLRTADGNCLYDVRLFAYYRFGLRTPPVSFFGEGFPFFLAKDFGLSFSLPTTS